MRNSSRMLLCLLAVVATSGFLAIAADSEKEIEALLRGHADATLKADQARLRAVETSRDNTIALMVKVAGRAYTAKDRFSETNAWKAVLRLDREHKKARQYFGDLGTLDQVLTELPHNDSAETAMLPRFVGKWQGVFHTGTKETITISNDGIVILQNQPKVKCQFENTKGGAAILVRRPNSNCLNRYTLAGEKLLFEQWDPHSTYPKSAPSAFGYAVRVE